MRFLVLLLYAAMTAAQSASTPSQEPATVPSQAASTNPPLLELDGTQQRPVTVSRMVAIHAADDPVPEGLTPIQRAMQGRDRISDNMLGVELSVVLNMNGRVDSAKAVGGPKRFYEQAVDLEMHREFEPVRDDHGTIVPAHFTDYVSVYPPERWLDHPVAFPERVDLRSFRMTLERTGCFGSCPPYRATISGSGDVTWEGGQFVAAPGTHHAKISRDAVQSLVDEVRGSRMLSALDEYRAGWTDNPTYTLTLDVNGVHKQVEEYIGPIVGMPLEIRELEQSVDRIAGTERWIKGGPALMTALTAEHWNFAATSKDNLQLYDSALEHSDGDVLAAFARVHGPVFSVDPQVASPVCVASRSLDSHQALEMLASVPKSRKLPQHAMDGCLCDAARAGNLELVIVWLKRGASVTPAPVPMSVDYTMGVDHPLTAAVQGGAPVVVQWLLDAHAPVGSAQNGGRNLLTFAGENGTAQSFAEKRTILEMLLHAGADPNEETERDKPALFAVNYEPQLVPFLVAHGAEVNRRDNDGNTPLMSVTDIKALRALLDAGADPTERKRDGKTAGEDFRAWGMKEQADLLDAAVKSRLGQPGRESTAASSATSDQ